MSYTDDSQDKAPTALKYVVAEDMRPREKAMAEGFDNLNVPELLAIIIGSGSVGEDVTTLCKRMFDDNGGKLFNMARLSYRDFMKKYNGIGEVKALQILAALELGRRYHTEQFDKDSQICSSRDAYEKLRYGLQDLDHEEIHVLLLNRGKHVLGTERVSSGGTAMTVGDVKMIIKPAIDKLADGIILAHNHPGATPRPSGMDNSLTANVKRACEIMGIEFVDHIIVCPGNQYYSYNDHGAL